MEKLIDIKEVCRVLGVKEHWLYTKVRERKIPHYRVEGHLRFSIAEINQYLKQNHWEART